MVRCVWRSSGNAKWGFWGKVLENANILSGFSFMLKKTCNTGQRNCGRRKRWCGCCLWANMLTVKADQFLRGCYRPEIWRKKIQWMCLSFCHRFMLFRRTLFSSWNCRWSTLSRKFFRSTYLQTHRDSCWDNGKGHKAHANKHLARMTMTQTLGLALFLVSVWV